MKKLRSMLFMPGNNPGMLVSADNLEADAIIYDLEDAVSLREKDAARDLVYSAISSLTYENSFLTVRINPIDSPYFYDDLEMIAKAKPDGIVIPKASVESVQKVDQFLADKNIDKDIRYFILVESAMSILHLEEIVASSEKIDGILLGGEDYSVDLEVDRSDLSDELAFARYKIATVAKAYKINAIDTPYTDIDNIKGLKDDTSFVKSIGFTGKLIVGPRQVHYINEIFAPTNKEIEEAQIIVQEAKDAEEKGLGVFSFKGKMVDKPVIARSENLLKSAKDWGLI